MPSDRENAVAPVVADHEFAHDLVETPVGPPSVRAKPDLFGRVLAPCEIEDHAQRLARRVRKSPAAKRAEQYPQGNPDPLESSRGVKLASVRCAPARG
jgi:hypothetical protein